MARKVFKYVILAVIAINLAILSWILLVPSSPPRVVLPNPNGYDDFVRAGQMMATYNGGAKSSNQVAYADTMTREELGALVASNEAVLKLVEEGLTRESREPIEYSTNYAAVLMPRLASFKGLAWLLLGAGRLAEMEGRTNDAANFYLEGVRFGQECERGGLVISRLVGIACEAIALMPLPSLANRLDAPKLRELARALEAIDTTEEPVEQTIATEKLWSRKTYGFRGQIDRLINKAHYQKTLDSVIARTQRIQLQRRWLIVNLAARSYALEKGKQPQSVAELVPDYLKAVPKDPATGKELSLTGR